MKKRIKKQLKIAVLTVVFSSFMPNWANAQQIDNRLWGTWRLSMVEITTDGVTRACTSEALLADKSNLPRNLFTGLYFFDEKVGVNSTETEFVPSDRVRLKGTFTANNGTLIITLRGEEPREFSYEVGNELLNIRYTEGDTQFYLIYKLSLKNVQ